MENITNPHTGCELGIGVAAGAAPQAPPGASTTEEIQRWHWPRCEVVHAPILQAMTTHAKLLKARASPVLHMGTSLHCAGWNEWIQRSRHVFCSAKLIILQAPIQGAACNVMVHEQAAGLICAGVGELGLSTACATANTSTSNHGPNN